MASRQRPYWMHAYYGPNAEHPRVCGELAIETEHATEHSLRMEIAVAEGRAEIGDVVSGKIDIPR